MHSTSKPQAVARCWKGLLSSLLLPAVLSTGCQSTNNTERGLVGGAVLGTAAGALLGAATGHAGRGALIGAAAGTAVGGLAGASEDHHEKKVAQASAQAVAAAEQRSQYELSEIARMTREGVSEGLIINHVRQCGVVFNLSGEQISWLSQLHVSDRVISEMQMTANAQPQVIYTRPVYVAPPPPQVGVGVGIRIR